MKGEGGEAHATLHHAPNSNVPAALDLQICSELRDRPATTNATSASSARSSDGDAFNFDRRQSSGGGGGAMTSSPPKAAEESSSRRLTRSRRRSDGGGSNNNNNGEGEKRANDAADADADGENGKAEEEDCEASAATGDNDAETENDEVGRIEGGILLFSTSK